jgi:hypothetical protein
MALQRYKIGDTVTIRSGDGSGDDKLYIVTGINEYKKFEDNRFVDTFDYELILIYPVEKGINYKLEEQDDLLPYAKYKTKMWTTMINFVKKDRQKKSMYGEPEFLKIVENALLNNMGLKKVEIPRIAMKSPDAHIGYEGLETVDECLDCMNDLKMLEEMLDDKEFRKTRKKVVKRLKELLK